MSDFELLQRLQRDLIEVLRDRKAHDSYYGKHGTKARIRRLRLEITRLMLEIERKCNFQNGKEGWE